MKRGRALIPAGGLPSSLVARRSSSWLMTAFTVKTPNRSLNDMSAEEGDGVVGTVRFEKICVHTAQRPKTVLQQLREAAARDRTHVRIAGHVAVRPVTELGAPRARLNILDDDAQPGRTIEQHAEPLKQGGASGYRDV